MCSVICLRRPSHRWPLLIAANRDEMAGRPWQAPAAHWPEAPDCIGGLDELAGGSWLAINQYGVVAAILNRYGTLGPEAGKRSRGELILEALNHADSAEAAEALAHLNGAAYRPFNLLIADTQDAFWLANREGSSRPTVTPLPEGLSMLTAFDLNDQQHDPRIATFLPAFQTAPSPDPEADNGWQSWQDLLAKAAPEGYPATAGLCFQMDTGFGTSSSSLLALPHVNATELSPQWLFAGGKPDRTPFSPLPLFSLS